MEDSFDPFGKPGAGAPRRSDSGNVMASIVADPDTRFQKQLKKEIEHSLVSVYTQSIVGSTFRPGWVMGMIKLHIVYIHFLISDII